MKTSKVFRKAVKNLVEKRVSPITNAKLTVYWGCCHAISPESIYYNNPYSRKFSYLYFKDAPATCYFEFNGFYFGERTKENLLTRELALLFAAEYYEDLGD